MLSKSTKSWKWIWSLNLTAKSSSRGLGSALEVHDYYFKSGNLRNELWEVKTTASAMSQRQTPGVTSKGGAFSRRELGTKTTGDVLGGPPLSNWRTEVRLPKLEAR